MILPDSFEKSWIQQISKSLGKKGDPRLIEKIIYAFALLEQLKISGLDLIFKGGTYVFLLADPPNRFSIDIDIIVRDSSQDMTLFMDRVVRSGLFVSWKDDNERKTVVNAPVLYYFGIIWNFYK